MGSNTGWLVPFLIKRGDVDTETDRQTCTQSVCLVKMKAEIRAGRWTQDQGTPKMASKSERKATPDHSCISHFSPGWQNLLLCKRLCLWYFVTAQAFGMRQVKTRRYVDMHSSLQFWKIIILHFIRPPSLFPVFDGLFSMLTAWRKGWIFFFFFFQFLKVALLMCVFD